MQPMVEQFERLPADGEPAECQDGLAGPPGRRHAQALQHEHLLAQRRDVQAGDADVRAAELAGDGARDQAPDRTRVGDPRQQEQEQQEEGQADHAEAQDEPERPPQAAAALLPVLSVLPASCRIGLTPDTVGPSANAP